MDAVPAVHAELDRRWVEVFGGPPPPFHPFLRLGSWVGGDQDGNPHARAKTLRDALRAQKQMVLEPLPRLGSGPLCPIQPVHPVDRRRPLAGGLHRRRRGADARGDPRPGGAQPGRTVPAQAEPGPPPPGGQPGPAPGRPGRAPLLHRARAARRPRHGRRRPAPPARGASSPTAACSSCAVRSRAFDFCGYSLDVRFHSSRLREVASAILRQSGQVEGNLDALDEEAAVRLLARAMQQRGPHIGTLALSPDDRDLVETLVEMGRAQRAISPRATESVVISMTHSPVEVMAAMWLASLVGLVSWSFGEVHSSRLDLVPLMETIAGLRAGPALAAPPPRPARVRPAGAGPRQPPGGDARLQRQQQGRGLPGGPVVALRGPPRAGPRLRRRRRPPPPLPRPGWDGVPRRRPHPRGAPRPAPRERCAAGSGSPSRARSSTTATRAPRWPRTTSSWWRRRCGRPARCRDRCPPSTRRSGRRRWPGSPPTATGGTGRSSTRMNSSASSPR